MATEHAIGLRHQRIAHIAAAAFVVPALTTIRQPYVGIASQAVSLLMKLIAGKTPGMTRIVLPREPVIRHSTARPL